MDITTTMGVRINTNRNNIQTVENRREPSGIIGNRREPSGIIGNRRDHRKAGTEMEDGIRFMKYKKLFDGLNIEICVKNIVTDDTKY
jgi:hypothetical protein